MNNIAYTLYFITTVNNIINNTNNLDYILFSRQISKSLLHNHMI